MTSQAPKKVQVKMMVDRAIYRKLKKLCDKTRRTTASMVEFMTLETERTGAWR